MRSTGPIGETEVSTLLIRDEITNDPLGRGYAGMSDQAVADSLNTKDRTKLIPISSNELLAWSVYDGRLARIKAGIDGGVDDVDKSLCEVCYILIKRDNTDLDLNEQSRVDMLDALVSYGRLTDAERTDLYTRATLDITRAQELGIRRVRVGDVSQARS